MLKCHVPLRDLAVTALAAMTVGANVAAARDSAAAYKPRASTVGDGLGPAPGIDPGVRTAAEQAGCTTRAFAAEPNGVAYARKTRGLHAPGNLTWSLSRVPTNGLHLPVWADFGFYNQPVPYGYQVHDLEHGAVIVHFGTQVIGARITALRQFWSRNAAYLLVVPDRSPSFPKNGVVATSWQRSISCTSFIPARSLPAIGAVRDAYRGTGRESVPPFDAHAKAPGLPMPLIPDTTSSTLGKR